MLFLFGLILLALGLLSGSALVLSTVGILAVTSGITLWLMFPLLSIVGYVMMAMQAEPAQVRTVSVTSSAVLLLLALASVVVLVLSAASLLPAPSSSASLWFVLVVGVALGSIGAATFGRASGDASKAP
jgi:hypothetical protein